MTLENPTTLHVLRERRSYVLLLTLVLIPLAGVALAGVERLSVTRALDASRAEQELQRRWLEISCRQAFFNHVPAILEERQSETGKPALDVSAAFQIGTWQLQIIFTDEEAKPNLNTLWNTRDPQQCDESLGRLMRGCRVPLALHPTPPELAGMDSAAIFGTYGQVFGTLGPRELSPVAPDSPTGHLTLWGSGKLNFHKATQESLEEIGDPVLGIADVQKILTLRRDQPALGVPQLFDQLELTKDQRKEAVKRLTDRSTCFGMWIVLKNSQGQWTSFTVGQTGAIQLMNW